MVDRTTRVETVVAAPPFSRISWGSILAGTLVAFALQLLLNLVGLGIGLAAVDVADGAGFASVGVTAGLWWGVSAIISLLTGGWVAARLAGVPIRTTAILHGLSVWALATLLTVWLATTTLATAVSGAFGAVGQIGQVTASAVGGVIGDDSSAGGARLVSAQNTIQDAGEQRSSVMRSIRAEATEIYRQVVSQREQQAALNTAENTASDVLQTPGDIGQDLNQLVDRLFASGGVFTEEDRAEALNVLQQRFGISEEEANAIVDNWQERYQAAVQQVDEAVSALQQEANDAAEAATAAVGAAAGWTSLALALGLLAAVLGGMLGKPEPWMVEAMEDENTTV